MANDQLNDQLRKDLEKIGRLSTLLNLLLSGGTTINGVDSSLKDLIKVATDIRTRLADLPPHTVVRVDPQLGEATVDLLAEFSGSTTVPDTYDSGEYVPHLYDSETGEKLGVATEAQIYHSTSVLDGHILIDSDGDVVTPGSWDAQQPGTRKVYVQ